MNITMRRLSQFTRRLVAITCAAVCVGACSCCGSTQTKTIEITHIAPNEYQWSALLSEYGWSQTSDHGNLLLIRSDGTFDIAPVGYMQQGRISWSPDGLFIADKDTDHVLGNSAIHEVNSTKGTDIADAVVWLPGGKWVGSFDAGRTAEGNDERIVITDGVHSQLHQSGHKYSVLSACGTDVYGLSSDMNNTESTSQILHHLVYNDGFREASVGTYAPVDGEFTAYQSAAPCQKGIIYVPSIHHSSSGIGEIVLERFNTALGNRIILPLVMADGTPLADYLGLWDGSLESATQMQDAIVGDSLYMVMASGHIVRVNLVSGVCEIVSDELHTRFQPNEHTHYTFHGALENGRMNVLVEDGDASLTNMSIVSFAVPSGKITSDIQLKGLDDALPDDLLVNDFHANPRTASRHVTK